MGLPFSSTATCRSETEAIESQSAPLSPEFCAILQRMKPLISVLTVILGIGFVALAAYYWLTPAGSLPTYFPGYEQHQRISITSTGSPRSFWRSACSPLPGLGARPQSVDHPVSTKRMLNSPAPRQYQPNETRVFVLKYCVRYRTET